MIRALSISIFMILMILKLPAQDNFKQMLDSAEYYYTNGSFNKSAVLYQALVDTGFESAELYYNLGNAYFKSNQLADAILYYEKASLLNPNDEDIKFNLELSRSYLTDKINKIPDFFLNRWIKSVRNLYNTNQWAIISISSFVILLTLIALLIFSYKTFLRKLFFYMGILFLIISLSSLIFSIQQKNMIINSDNAIIYSSVVTAKSSPDDLGVDLFIIHDGTKVRILQTKNEWIKIRLEDGKEGWILSSDVKRI
ncbi:MAG: tetratricopeptide repeat protein [Marinilabiliales bacterium]